MTGLRVIAAAVILPLLYVTAVSADVRFTQHEDSIDVMINGSLSTVYRYGEELAKPVLFPVYTQQGVALTRNYPFAEVEGESHDHPHHTGVFFTVDEVNGNRFWGNTAQSPKIRHIKTVSVSAGDKKGSLKVLIHWIGANGKVLLEEARTMTFIPSAGSYSMDFDITLTAADTTVTFLDTKEGMFAIRVAPWLRENGGNGKYLSSRGGTSANEIWGRRAEWVSLEGNHDGCTAGVVIMHHSGSENYPTFWHARDYGLFSANPLGQSAFEKGTGIENPTRYDLTLTKGQSALFRFRMLIHDGPLKPDSIAREFESYNTE